MNKIHLISLLTLMATLSGLAYFSISQNQVLKQSANLLIEQSDIYQQWIQWIERYQKAYRTEEIPLKFQAFAKNYKIVESHNSNPAKTYTLGLNKFADLSAEEFTAHILKQIPNTRASQSIVEDSTSNQIQLPQSVNWTAKGAVTPVKDQLQCGSSPFFSISGSVESINFIKNGKLESFSEQQLVDCTYSVGNQGCCGGYMDQTYQYIMKDGLELESSYPYKGVDQNCSYKADLVKLKIKGYHDIVQNSSLAIQQVVANQPVSAVVAFSESLQLYSSGIYNDKTCGTELEHPFLIVGYNIKNKQNYWIIKNSFGKEWGMEGYMLMAFDPKIKNDVGICGINLMSSYPTL